MRTKKLLVLIMVSFSFLIYPRVSIGFGSSFRDSDHDGVLDVNDKCPNTPAGRAVDEKGCPLFNTTDQNKDTDKDGVPDYIDMCPYTPLGERVNQYGCEAFGDLRPPPPPPLSSGCPGDRDCDGVEDRYDDCPDSPPGSLVGPDGCHPGEPIW